MEAIADVKFLKIDRSKYDFKYVDGCWPFIYYPKLDGKAGCQLYFGVKGEAFDEDIVEVTIRFLDESIHIGKLSEGDDFYLYVGDVHIAIGKIKILAI